MIQLARGGFTAVRCQRFWIPNRQKRNRKYLSEACRSLMDGELRRGTASADGQRALHVLALRILRECAIVGKAAGLVCAELERHGLAGARALGDAVAVDREAVGDVLRREG